jgi:hypothetical protein
MPTVACFRLFYECVASNNSEEPERIIVTFSSYDTVQYDEGGKIGKSYDFLREQGVERGTWVQRYRLPPKVDQGSVYS